MHVSLFFFFICLGPLWLRNFFWLSHDLKVLFFFFFKFRFLTESFFFFSFFLLNNRCDWRAHWSVVESYPKAFTVDWPWQIRPCHQRKWIINNSNKLHHHQLWWWLLPIFTTVSITIRSTTTTTITTRWWKTVRSTVWNALYPVITITTIGERITVRLQRQLAVAMRVVHSHRPTTNLSNKPK